MKLKAEQLLNFIYEHETIIQYNNSACIDH